MNKNKTSIAIALFLMFAMAISLVALPVVTAQPPTMKTYPFIDAIPNPVGVGEQVLLRFGILEALGKPGQGWIDITITVGRPDGLTETLGPFTTDSTGGTTYIYTPDRAGTYKLTTNFPEQTAPATWFSMERLTMIFEGTIMKKSTSETIDLVVQEEPLPYYPAQPLPTEYWSRPIDPQLREWAPIAGNWMQRPDNGFAPYNDDAPETAHVLWAKPLTTGGLTGGLWGDGQVPAGSDTGDAYAGKFIDSVILNGVLYYNRDDEYAGSKGIVAVDLRTGKELWSINNTVLSFGQIFYWNSFNFDGVFTYLWDTSGGSTWKAYDPFSGQWIYTMTDVPSGTRVFGPSGEILIYQIDFNNRWMALWNSTAVGQTAPNFAMDPTTYGSWHNFWGGNLVHGSTLNASDPRAYSWNVTIPAVPGMSYGLKVYPDRVVCVDFNQTRVRVWALSTKGLYKASTSTSLLFDKSWNAPAEWLEGLNILQYTGATNEVENGVIAMWSKELRKHYAFSTEDGSYMWETDSEHWLDAYGWGNMEHTWYFAYGKLFSVGVGGILYAYDDQTGDIVWTYELTDPYRESVAGNRWWGWIGLIADGKVYLGHLEHSAEQPIPRGAPFVCLNETTGDVIWRVNGMFRQTRWGGCAVIGDSIIATMDTYDQRIYAIGKGPSATSVAASPKVSVHGSSVLVEGMVTDISAGTKDDALTARFPNGVAAVSDDSMSDWMLYVYKQFQYPTNATGVEVTLDTVDPNGNWIHIGTVTSDSSGMFSCQWKPEVPGKYTVIATFAGSKSYYASYAETAIGVDEAPPATPPPAYPQPIDPTWTIVAIGIAIIIAVAIVGVLMLRKRP
jgi:hypothetical protein